MCIRDRIRGGKADLQKLLDMFLARGQKFLSVGEPSRLSHFLFHARYAMSLSLMAQEQAPLNHGFWGEKDLVEDGMNLLIPSVIMVPSFSAVTEAFPESKQVSFQE